MRILNRFNGELVKEINADLSSADLSSADLRYADLRYANLSSANLSSANLRYANLSSADLSSADLRYANLSSANLSSANLRYANLSSADLSFADFSFAKINWQSHALIAELIRRAAGSEVEKRMVAGLVAVSLDWCWDRFLAVPTDLKEWALDVLAGHVVEGDEAPDVLKERTLIK